MGREFEALGLVVVEADARDGRRRRLVPTAKARREAAAIRAFNQRLEPMFDALFAEIGCPLIPVIDRLDVALDARSIADRLASRSDLEGSRA